MLSILSVRTQKKSRPVKVVGVVVVGAKKRPSDSFSLGAACGCSAEVVELDKLDKPDTKKRPDCQFGQTGQFPDTWDAKKRTGRLLQSGCGLQRFPDKLMRTKPDGIT